jgi:hypothetical protein
MKLPDHVTPEMWAEMIHQAEKEMAEFRQELLSSPSLSHLEVGEENPEFLSIPAGKEEYIGNDAVLMSSGIVEETGDSLWRNLLGRSYTLDRFFCRHEVGDAEHCVTNDARDWFEELQEYDLQKEIPQREFDLSSESANWEHRRIDARFKDEEVEIALQFIKETCNVGTLFRLWKRSGFLAFAHAQRAKGILFNPRTREKYPVGWNYPRMVRVRNSIVWRFLQIKERNWLSRNKARVLKALKTKEGTQALNEILLQRKILVKPYKFYHVSQWKKEEKETSSEDALDKPREGFFRALNLQEVSGIGQILSEALEGHFGSLEAVSRASMSELMECFGVGLSRARRIIEELEEKQVVRASIPRGKKFSAPVLVWREEG